MFIFKCSFHSRFYCWEKSIFKIRFNFIAECYGTENEARGEGGNESSACVVSLSMIAPSRYPVQVQQTYGHNINLNLQDIVFFSLQIFEISLTALIR